MTLVTGGLAGMTLVVGGLGGTPPTGTGGTSTMATPMTLVVGGLGGSYLVVGGLGSGATPTPTPTLTFREALRAQLEATTDLTAVVGNHIYPGILPKSYDLQRDGPALAYSVTADRNLGRNIASIGHHLRGPDGTTMVRVQLSAFSYSFADVDVIAEVLFAEFDGQFNVVWAGIPIVSSIREQEIDLPEPPTADRPRAIYQIASEFHIRFRNSRTVL